MTEQFARILRQYGRDVQLQGSGKTVQVRAFVQRIQRQETRSPAEETNFGAADLRRWLYIGPAEQALRAADGISFDGEAYLVQTAAAIYAGGEKSHWWAVLRPAREALA